MNYLFGKLACVSNLHVIYPLSLAMTTMSSQTTLGWSLLSSGVVTIILTLLPGDDRWWGIGLCVLGLTVFYTRRNRGF
jgi:hypothetical protein